jgi:pyruvate/2-oxoglutarate dehydrogenase complex dihydrolipoamide acyltransferase (E2) component
VSMRSNFFNAFSQLVMLLKEKPPAATHLHYPKLRNFILDIMVAGRRKNIINLLLEIELTRVQEYIENYSAQHNKCITLTSFICKSFACAVDEDKSMQGYRQGKSKLVIFDDVDLSVMVERDVDGHMMPVTLIVRAANQKGIDQISQEIREAKTSSIGSTGPMSALDKQFFSLPRLLRKIVWFEMRRDPYLFKQLVGTVGVTSMGMYASGPAVVIPITPMTLTLSIGAIHKRLVLENGIVVERDFIQMNLAADHDIIDGAPLMRFLDRFKRKLLSGAALE